MDNIDTFLHAKFSHYGWTVEAIVELTLAAMCGGLVGLERELRGRQAGFRTNMLVCVGSALVMIVSNHVARMHWPAPSGQNVHINVDPARIAYGVMTGIGFLGAGVILKQGSHIRGLTTAAGLWCVAGMGLAAGLGMYVVASISAVLTVIALWILDYFEEMLPTTHFRQICVRCRWEPGAIDRVVDFVKGLKFKIVDVHFQRTADLKDVDVDIRVAFGKKKLLRKLENKAQDTSGLHLMAIREP